jgi:hypothetical protein
MGASVTTIRDGLRAVDEKIQAAVKAVSNDNSASPVLVAVVEDFGRKSTKAIDAAAGDGSAPREAVIELEQAGDSSKYAAEADTGATDDTREAVLAAHMAICVLKHETS